MDFDLAGRVALVTGSSRGIGRAVAELLAREGAAVAITYRSGRDEASAVAATLRTCGVDADAFQLDLASDLSIDAAITSTLDRWGRLDILVNNAVEWAPTSMAKAPPFECLPADEWRRSLRVNLEGTFRVTQRALPSMRERGWGRIVTVSSVSASDGMRGGAWYSAVKTALHGVTRSLAREVGPCGVLVNVVMPGLTLTERTREKVPADIRERYAQATPIGRLLSPEDVASTVVFLCSSANTAITGEVVRASGGFVLAHESPPSVDRHTAGTART